MLQVTNPNAVAQTGVSFSNTFVATTGVSEGDTVIFTAPFSSLNQGQYRVIREYSNSIWIENPNAIEEEVTVIDNSNFAFYPYEASVPGDLFVVTGNILTLANAGSYPIVQVLSPTSVVVKGNMVSIGPINLNNNVNSVYVEEAVAYSGYKHVYMVSAEPGTTSQSLIVFDTTAQYNKINSSAGVELTSLGKLNFNTTLKNGLDAYRYNTGLIAEANRIVSETLETR